MPNMIPILLGNLIFALMLVVELLMPASLLRAVLVPLTLLGWGFYFLVVMRKAAK